MRLIFAPLLGLRLLRGQGRTGILRVTLMVAGTALGVVLLLVALSVQPVLQARDARLAARTPICAQGHLCGLGAEVTGVYQGHTYTEELVDAPAGTPAPAGLSRLPAPGQVLLSPALRHLATAPGNDLLLRRLPGDVVGTVGSAGLLQPDELLAYVGVAHIGSPQHVGRIIGWGGTVPKTAAASSTTENGVTPSGRVDPRKVTTYVAALALLLPVLLFLASCARLSARTRDRRLAALRLLGMTPLQTRIVNAVETGVAALGGSLLGWAVFELLRGPSSHVRLDGWGWFASDAHPTTPHLVELLLAAPFLAMTVSTIAVRAVTGGLLAGRSEPSVRRLRAWRLAPLAGGLALLTWTDARHHAFRDDVGMVLTGITLAVIGLAVSIPLLSQLAAAGLARVTGSLSLQLGARRMQADAPAVTRVVTGLVLLVFSAGLVQSILLAVHSETEADANPWSLSLRPSVITVPSATSDHRAIPPSTWSALRGVTSVVALRQLAVTAGAGPTAQGAETSQRALVATCADLASVLGAPVDGCNEGVAYWFPDVGAQPKTLTLQAISPLTSSPDGSSVTISSPRQALQSGFPDALGNTFGASLLLPPTTPGLSRLADQPPSTYYLLTDGKARTVEEVRTAAAAADPTATVSTAAEIRAATSGVSDYHFALYGELIDWGTAAALLVAFASVAVTTVDRAVERRRHLAMQSAIGVPVSIMRRAQLTQVLLPYSIGITFAATLSILAGLAYTDMVERGATASVPMREVAVTVGVALVGALVVAVSVLPSIGRPVTADQLRQE
jgi:hypothetical protein